MKILFFLTWPVEDASSRMRVCQFATELDQRTMTASFDILFPLWIMRIKNRTSPLVIPLKLIGVAVCLVLRLIRLPRVLWYDVVFVHREGFPFFTPFFERVIRRMSKKMVFDFDDAIFLKPSKWKNWRDVFRDPSRVGEICSMSDTVVVGNQFLAEYALQFNKNVRVIPTVYKIKNVPTPLLNATPIIGWIGSWSTTINLSLVSHALSELAKQHDYILRLVGAKNIFDLHFEGVTTEYFEWQIDKELEYLNSFDIGIMPLFDTPWEKGKCAFKLIQYMSLGKPVVASPVGANNDVVIHGKSGFFASTDEEWITSLGGLIDDIGERRRLGEYGKQIVTRQYSFSNSLSKFIAALTD